MNRPIFVRLAFWFAIALGPYVAFGQVAPWTGQIQCQLAIQSNGYSHQEIQTWTITGPSTSAPGSMPVYPVLWSATSQGGTQQLRGTQTLAGQWKGSAPGMPAVIAIFIRASDKRLVVLPYHAQLRAQGALVGSRQMVSPGSAPTQSPLPSDVYEWPLPAIQDSASATSLVGTGTTIVSGMPMQPAATNNTANCKWHLTQGGTADTSGPSIRTAPPVGATPGSNPASGTPGTPLGQSGSTSTGQPGSQSQGTSTPSSQSCPSLQGAAIIAANTAVNLGTMSAGFSTTYTESLSSQTATKFFHVGLAGGIDATLKLDAGSDFDLYAYDMNGASLGCSQTRGSNSENLAVRFQNSQNNDVVIEVTAHTWSANGANFTLGIYASNLGSVSLPSQPNKKVYDPNSGTTASSAPPPPSCSDPGGSPTATAFNNPTSIGHINIGGVMSYTQNLNSVADRRFVETTIGPGAVANISLNAGSDYDLYIFNPGHTIVNCATTHGSNSENIKVQFDNSQTDNTIIIEVAAYGWSSGASNFTLNVSAERPGAGTQLPTGVQSTTLHTVKESNGNAAASAPSASTPQCADPGGSSASSALTNPIGLGTVIQGGSMDRYGTLTSVTDRAFFQVTLPPNTDAKISLTSGSDYDLYFFFSSPNSMTGCSTTRGASGEAYIMHFGNSQSNTIMIEVAAYTWSADAANFTLNVLGIASSSSSQALSGLTAQPIAVLQNLQLGSQSKQSSSSSRQQSSNQRTSSQTGTSGNQSHSAVSYIQNNVPGIWAGKQCTSCHSHGTHFDLSGAPANTYTNIRALNFNANDAKSHPLLTCAINTSCPVTGSTQHPGGQVLSPSSTEYTLILQRMWMA